MNTEFLSRERAAGYDPDVLNKATVLLVGVGALGQNALMNLALSQVDAINIVDFDSWESHNVTRSPFFSDPSESRRWGKAKAAVAAHKARQMTSWSAVPDIHYSIRPIQALGDAPFRVADAIVSAVDNQGARNYLGRKAAQHGVALIEGGFSGSQVSSTILINDPQGGPCWYCNLYQTNDRNREIQLSCTRAARQAEKHGFVPAIQSAAAFLGAFISEVAMHEIETGASWVSDIAEKAGDVRGRAL